MSGWSGQLFKLAEGWLSRWPRIYWWFMVGLGGLEPPTSPLSGRRPSQYLRRHHRLRGRGFKQHHFYGSRLFGKVLRQDDPREQRRHFSGIQLRVDSKPSHSVYECSSADTQSDCSAIRTAYAALALGKRLYDFLALLPFVLLSAGVDIRP